MARCRIALREATAANRAAISGRQATSIKRAIVSKVAASGD
jgi:hypothetical protein